MRLMIILILLLQFSIKSNFLFILIIYLFVPNNFQKEPNFLRIDVPAFIKTCIEICKTRINTIFVSMWDPWYNHLLALHSKHALHQFKLRMVYGPVPFTHSVIVWLLLTTLKMCAYRNTCEAI